MPSFVPNDQPCAGATVADALRGRDFLVAALARAGAYVTDTGAGLGSADVWVKIGGREYFIQIAPSNKRTPQ